MPVANDTPPRGRPLAEIETWIFDLDNTLYPSHCNLFAEAEARMAAFIVQELKLALTVEDAHALRRRFFLDHGTTLRGLMLEHGMEPKRFLDYVHDIDLTPVPPDPALVEAIAALPGRKLVFTNGTADYAARVIARIGLTGHFLTIHDIIACDYLPKPDPSGYAVLIRRHGVVPETALMVEDMARNLVPAAALGMTTAWVRTPKDWAREGAGPEHIHHVIDELAPWLRAAVSPLG
ncbi:MAG TPA: pyrimidine 5'-nucleotidase [Stellaceae bacterium]|nr:pyrimidine 5'-nucleotidase [Stellaceae bacterium]